MFFVLEHPPFDFGVQRLLLSSAEWCPRIPLIERILFFFVNGIVSRERVQYLHVHQRPNRQL